MKITDVRIRLLDRDDKHKANASVVIEDCFIVHGVKVILGSNGLFMAMPSRKNLAGEYKDIAHPTNSETREEMSKIVLDAYQKALEEEENGEKETEETSEETTEETSEETTEEISEDKAEDASSEDKSEE